MRNKLTDELAVCGLKAVLALAEYHPETVNQNVNAHTKPARTMNWNVSARVSTTRGWWRWWRNRQSSL